MHTWNLSIERSNIYRELLNWPSSAASQTAQSTDETQRTIEGIKSDKQIEKFNWIGTREELRSYV